MVVFYMHRSAEKIMNPEIYFRSKQNFNEVVIRDIH